MRWLLLAVLLWLCWRCRRPVWRLWRPSASRFRRLPRWRRRLVWWRYGPNCLRCGVRLRYSRAWWLRARGRRVYHCDHVVPYSWGGPDRLSNLQVLCAGCNMAKGNRSAADYRPAVRGWPWRPLSA